MSLPKHPTKSFVERNPHLYPVGDKFPPVKLENGAVSLGLNPDFKFPKNWGRVAGQPEFLFQITILGQIAGGKNNIIVTRTGHRFPKKSWANWRDQAIFQVRSQMADGFTTITEPVNVHLKYVAGDRRRRDMPAIVDSLFHCLEKSGVVSDDALLWVSQSSREYSKENPMAIMRFYKT